VTPNREPTRGAFLLQSISAATAARFAQSPQAQAERRTRAKAARQTAAASRDLRWPAVLFLFQLSLLIVCVVLYRVTGLSVKWSLPAPMPLVLLSLVIWMITYHRTRTDAALAYTLLFTGAMIVVATQYGVLAIGRPLADDLLVRMDSALGVSVPMLVAWAKEHPWLSAVMHYAYESYLPQQFAVIGLLALLRDRRGIWMFLTQQHLVLGTALLLCALWPASEPYAHLGLDVPHPQMRSVEQIVAFNSGVATEVTVNRTAGLVSFPSCHVAGAIFFVWAFRRVRYLREAAVVVNGMLIFAAVASGVHYYTDAVAGAILAGALIALTERLIPRERSERLERAGQPERSMA
jgi:hypothetical protein